MAGGDILEDTLRSFDRQQEANHNLYTEALNCTVHQFHHGFFGVKILFCTSNLLCGAPGASGNDGISPLPLNFWQEQWKHTTM